MHPPASEITDRLEAIASVAENWSDPDHPARERAVAATLEAENTFTEEAVAFALNQQTSLLTLENLREWLRDRRAETALNVGVLNAGNIPFVGLQDFLAVVLTGHDYFGTTSSKSPALLPAFAAAVSERCPSLTAEFVDAVELFDVVQAVVATGSDETAEWVREQCEAHGIPERRRLVRGHRFAVAVLDGKERDDDYERLAEDALLHEGMGCRNVAVIWAPRDLSPDELLGAFARFRAVFPPHESTPRRLKMQQAFLEAVDASHAHGEGLEFLISKGDPDEQQPGHIRWSEYDNLDDVGAWLDQHVDRIQLVSARDEVARLLETSLPIEPLGHAQRPALAWCPDGIDLIEFLAGLH